MLESQISLITDSLASEALINEASCTYYSETRLYEQVLKIGSLRNRTAERGGRQNAMCGKRDRPITCVFCGDLHLS